ncbi:uncharacterized protein LOC113236985 [Hyposmocoma kahamanoa]|uniref:uncharacterized protein LOC113236985 n=1 Tax=Hyposmocoma kahamanoa TaxID=1477025 RepID=UPI000E6D7DEB|nr:uncharacterized protein LOC113236985 [Hyposmocoma kahamanoa]
MGKYSYTDKEGNPIHVKYYADDQGYGVELKSVKFIKNDLKTSSQNKLENPEQLPKFEPTAEMYKYPKYLKKSVSRHQIDSLNKESPKNHLKNKYKGIDYEIYLQTVMPSQNCGHDEKVKIYNLEKDVDKKIRNVLNAIEVEKEPEDDTGIETPKFCELY